VTHPPRPIRPLAGLLLAALLAGGLTGCTSTQARPCVTDPAATGLAVAVGGRGNSPQPAVPAELDAEVDKIIEKTGADPGVGVTVVRVDGEPAVDCVVRFNADTGNSAAHERAVSDFTAAVTAGVSATTARAPESNPLEALALASAAAGPDGVVVLVDSGLQTVAPLDFRQPGLLGAGIDTVIGKLGDAGMLPDLSGRRVILSGIGFTAAPQRELNSAQRAHLVELWRRIAEEGGAQSVVVVPVPSSTPPLDGLPPVATVDVPAAGDLDLGCDTESILGDDGPVRFVGDRTDFVDPGAARAALTEFADWLASNPAARGHVTGSIAHHGTDAPGGLSGSRAERVRAMLVDLGAEPSQVSAEGIGWGPFPYRSAPSDEISDPLNRRVVIELSCP
jgi:outer membrane protein OmpA-like peptidoglycan-associated protein